MYTNNNTHTVMEATATAVAGLLYYQFPKFTLANRTA